MIKCNAGYKNAAEGPPVPKGNDTGGPLLYNSSACVSTNQYIVKQDFFKTLKKQIAKYTDLIFHKQLHSCIKQPIYTGYPKSLVIKKPEQPFKRSFRFYMQVGNHANSIDQHTT